MNHSLQTRVPVPVLITLASATLIASLGISVASVLLPTLTVRFDATVSEVQWVVLAYLMAVTITIVSAGRLGDLFGHRRMLTFGLIAFLAASVFCALAPTLGLLIFGRVVQGAGGAILITLPMSLARDLVPTERLGTAMGVLGTTSAVGTALGPSLGGILLAWSEWPLVFWILAALAAVVLVLALTFLERGSQRPNISLRELDTVGTCVLVVALAAYALATSGGVAGIQVPTTVLFVGALLAVSLFVFVESRVVAPLVPMALLRDRKTGIGFVMNIAVGTIMMSTLVVGPYFLAFSLGLNETATGLVMAIGPLVAALSGVPAGRLADRFGVKRVMVFGLVQTMIGLLCLAFLPRVFGVAGYVMSLVVLTPAFQLFLAANNTSVLVGAEKEQRGRLSGLLGLSRNLGLMTGASAMSSLFVAYLGTGNTAQASGGEIAQAFSMTFTTAAGLALAALGLAIYSHNRQENDVSDPAT